MKLKYILASLAAAATMLTGCVEEEIISSISGLEVSSSYLGLNAGDNYSSIIVNADQSWTVDPASIPDWLTVSPMNGAASQDVAVTFTAAENKKSERSCEVRIQLANGKTQLIKVIQEGGAAPAASTCADILNGENDVTYKVTATITKIANTHYGNLYIDDGTGEVYVYGVRDKKGNTNSGSTTYDHINDPNYANGWELAVGDKVTLSGPRTVYNGTIELKDVTIESVEKSLIKVETVPEEALPIEGGEFDIILACKGDGISVVIPDEMKSWLSVVGITTSGTTATVSFLAAPNAGGDRNAELSFVTTSAGETYSAVTTIAQKGSIIECTVAEFNAAEVGDTQYRITAVVSSIAKAEYGNIYIRDWSGETYIYGIGAKGDFEKTGIKVGDIITVVGKRGAYGTTIEMLNTVVENIISVSEVDFPAFNAAEKSKDVYYRLTGTISSIANAQYGNLYIKDDAGNEVYVYGLYPGYGAQGDDRKNFLATAGIEVGDILTVEGYKDVYNGTIELCGGIYISHEKGGAPEDPEIEDGGAPGTVIFTDSVIPTAYGEESVVSVGSTQFYVNQVGNFGNGIQFKKEAGYVANKTALGKIKKITVVPSATKTWYPSNLKLFAGSAEKPETEIAATGDDCKEYDLSGKDCSYFKLANTSGYAVYLESIKIEFE